jgi:hypothetical protein
VKVAREVPGVMATEMATEMVSEVQAAVMDIQERLVPAAAEEGVVPAVGTVGATLTTRATNTRHDTSESSRNWVSV